MHAVQISISDGTWKDELKAPETPVADTGFVPGTYGGIEFKTVEDVTKYYVAAYDKTKAETAMYIDADGTAVVKINTATQKIVEADYDMKVTASVTHASISVVKDKSATLVLDYIQHFPASDEYLKESRGLTRK